MLLFAACSIPKLAFAQPGCPDITTGPNQSVDCNITCVDLSATVLETGTTTDYNVSSVPYAPPAPFTGGTAQFINTDDVFGDVINLPFNFCFYGNTFNQVVIGANGLVSFDAAVAGQYCEYSFNDPIPSSNLYTNCIMGAYHDIDPSQGGSISYFIQGAAPCRIFAVSFNDVPHFSCNCGFFGGCSRTSQQIVIYETTNVIEVYLQQKETCNGWNNGNAVVGIQNATGAAGVTPPGRNTGSWTANNEGWRFTPSGTPNFEVNWYKSGNLIGTGLTVNVCPSATTTYDAEAIYTNCDGAVVTVTDQVTVTQNSTVSVNVNPTTVDVCSGTSTTLTASSPNAGMNYTWTPTTGLSATTGASVDATPATTTTYTVTGNDGNCSASANATINVVELSITSSSTDATCVGNDGTATATPTSGTAPYTYSWNTTPVQTTQTANNLAAGDYDVTVSDALGCSVTETVTVAIGAGSLSPPTMTATDEVCGAGNGTATATPIDGTAPYIYQWDDPNTQTTQTATGLTSGTYEVTITDAGGCSATNTVVVGVGAGSISAPTMTSTDDVCNSSNGTATATPVDGTAPFTYEWDDPSAQTTQTATGLAAGTYNVTLTDVGGCQSTASVVVGIDPGSLSASINTFSNITCNGDCDGEATVDIQNGVAPIGYLWDDPQSQTSQTATGLCAGTFNVTVLDANGCSATASVNLTEPTSLAATATMDQQSTCGNPDGIASVTASGGAVATDYTYSWNSAPAQTTATASGLPPASYEVTVTDDNGCSTSASIDITSTPSFTASIQSFTDATCFGACDGEATVEVDAVATQPVTYSWSSVPSQTTQTATGLCAGNYSVTVTDADGCLATTTATIDEPLPVSSTLSASSTSICIGESATLGAVVVGGTQPYANYTWVADPADASLDPTLQNPTVSPTITTDYTFTATDANGCSTIPKFITVEVLSALSLDVTRPLFSPDTGICPNDFAIIDLQATGGDGNYTYYLQPDNTTPIQLPLQVQPSATATYTFTVEDGCTTPSATATSTIAVYELPLIDFTGDNLSGCHEHTVNFIDETTPSPASWSWSFGDANAPNNTSSTQNPTHVFSGAGLYDISLQVTTAEGCVADSTKTDYIEVYPQAVANFNMDPERTTVLQASIEFTDLSTPEIASWNWNFGTGDVSTEQNPIYNYTDTGTFVVWLEVETVNGCIDNTRKNVIIDPDFMFYVPNSFTPNDDGKNDTFRPYGEGVDWGTFEMRIYNRWGEEIYFTANIDEPWDGWFNNREVEIGVYVYLIQINDISGKIHTYRDGVSVVR